MGRPKKQRRSRAKVWLGRISAFFGICFALVLAALIGGTLWAGVKIRHATEGMPTADLMNRETPGGITQVYSTDKVLLGEIYSRFQERVRIEDVPAVLKDATIAIEDERFYEHPGIDLRAVARAVYKNAREGRNSEGASTLTQQLVRNVILKNYSKTMDRKLQEALLAYQVERSMTKDQILERYLNEVGYGGPIYGVKMAAKLYLGKDLKKVTVSEAAMIAGLVQNPKSTYPFRRYDAAMARRNVVLGKMLQLGKIDQKQYDAAKAEKIKILKTAPTITKFDFKAPYFVNYVLKQLVRRYGADLVYQGGLKIYTTLNWEMQQKAEEILTSEIKSLHGDGITEGALITLEPHQGWIRAMVGGVDFTKDKYNFATTGQGRQVGSTFKPIVYATAFQSGKYDADSDVVDSPIKKIKGVWWPTNYGKRPGSGSRISIREAVAHSKNTVPAQIIQRVGWKPVVSMAKALGIKSKINSNDLSICLGTSSATPLEMASVYSVFANGGNRAAPMAVRLILDGNGNVIEKNDPSITRAVLSETAAANIGKCLEAVVDHGTATAAGVVEGARGKTGTTTDNTDAWFIGYTKELVTAVWMCNKKMVPGKDPKTKQPKMMPVYNKMDSSATGGHKCTPIWAKFMQVAVPIQQRAGLEAIPLPEDAQRKRAELMKAPPTPKPDQATEEGEIVVSICAESSKRATPFCPDTIEKNFPAGTIIHDCRLHTKKEETTTEEASGDLTGGKSEATETAQEPPTPKPTATPKPTPKPELPAPKPVRRSEPLAPRTGLAESRGELADEEEEVTLCSETGKRANPHCPEKIVRRVRKGTRIRECKTHKPRPGEEDN